MVNMDLWEYEDKNDGLEEKVKVKLIDLEQEYTAHICENRKEQKKKEIWDEYHQYKTNYMQEKVQQ